MKESTADLLAEIEKTIEGLNYPSEADYYPLRSFFWETKEKGELTTERLLLSSGFLTPATLQEFIDFVATETHWNGEPRYDFLGDFRQKSLEEIKQIAEAYKGLLGFLERNFHEIKIYLVRNIDKFSFSVHDIYDISDIQDPKYSAQAAFYVILGKTNDGMWIGISPDMDCSGLYEDKEMMIEDNPVVTNEVFEFKQELKIFLQNLEMPAADFGAWKRINSFLLEISSSRHLCVYKLLKAIRFIGLFEAAAFCDHIGNPELLGSDQEASFKKSEKQYRHLDNLLREKLTNLQEYIIGGDVVFHTYYIGKTADGNWLGVQTISIWT
ncbi:MAG: nuclease A inhibitor family protein [Aphanocapsa sp. GSE-SYN-MK-11-07L]|jgi:hypothetical protein|nr:nuclease A inhibitor family protein [Aphanocapsa sp. GSE-SYN-MK-11-07L]